MLVSDTQAPFKLFAKSRLSLSAMKSERFAGDIEFILAYQGIFMNHPLRFVHRNGSKVKSGSVLSMAQETVSIVRKYSFRNNKIYKGHEAPFVSKV